MESSALPSLQPHQPNTEAIKRQLLQKGVTPTPKILHTLRKKHLQKSLRKSKPKPSSPAQESTAGAEEEETHFQILKAEYRSFNKAIIRAKNKDNELLPMVGKPWESLKSIQLRELAAGKIGYGGESLKYEHLEELGDILEDERDKFRWLFDQDIEFEEGLFDDRTQSWVPPKPRDGDRGAISFLVSRLSDIEMSMKDWKFSKLMKHSGLQFTEGQMLKIVDELGRRRKWKHALSVVKWVYNSKEHKHFKSRFVFTKLLAVLGKARRPREALEIFNLMRADGYIYPDMAAYRCIAVTLGQAGLLKELVNIIECMKQKPSRKITNMRSKMWDPVLQPDLVVYNAVLNACVPSCQWKGVSWVFEQLRKSGLRPNGATYGLAMEVMMQSGKYDLVHSYFEKMKKSGEAPKAITYKVLVKTFWEEGKVNEAVEIVRDMELKGVVGVACVYYELACCLCYNGRWKEALTEIEKLKRLPQSRPLGVAFTGMILSSMDGGHVDNCISIFEHCKEHCDPNIGVINAMLKVYGRNDMFYEAKELFEGTKRSSVDNTHLNYDDSSPDRYTYSLMLEVSASADQWEYFDHVYKEMVFSGYQVDQNRHVALLIEASRAGKWHLLEHAFDTILEAGEVLHSAFFTEMVCQATIRHDFEQAATILNSMAHASFQVSEKQWMTVFEEHEGTISRSNLELLLDAISNNNIVIEASVSNLLKLLQSICGDNFRPSTLGTEAANESSSLVNARRSMYGSEDCGYDEDGYVHFTNEARDFSDQGAGIRETLDLDIDEEFDIDMLTNETGNYDKSELPTAEKVLENWKESMKKDGIFFPFQLGKK